jgi:dolichol-phosphate mannosyltransferase
MYSRLREGYEVIYARRRNRKGEDALKRSTANLFYRIISKITSISIPVDTGDFRIITRKVAEVLKKMPEQNKFLRGQIAWIGFKQHYVEYEREERFAGKTSYTYTRMLRFAIDGITSFSNLPLKFATLSGFFVSGIAFLIMLYALYSRYILKDYVEGWTSLILSVMFIGGIQLICIGIIGEYISRIMSNIRNRPLYIINETNL